jgi:hypothetical protein
MTFNVIASRMFLILTSAIGQVRINLVRRIEVMFKRQNKTIDRDKLRKNRTLTKGGGFSLLKGSSTASGRTVGTPLSNKWAMNPSILSAVKATG